MTIIKKMCNFVKALRGLHILTENNNSWPEQEEIELREK